MLKFSKNKTQCWLAFPYELESLPWFEFPVYFLIRVVGFLWSPSDKLRTFSYDIASHMKAQGEAPFLSLKKKKGKKKEIYPTVHE